MIHKRTLLNKILSNGITVEFALVMEDGVYHAGMYVNGNYVNGPKLPQSLQPPKADITHWMGNKPSVGLTADEARRIIEEVDIENSVLEHRSKSFG